MGEWRYSFMLQLLYPWGKGPWYPLDRRMGRPQSQYGRSGKEKNSQPVSGIKSQLPSP